MADIYSLTSMTIPAGVTTIGANAFDGCSFTTLTIEGAPSIGAYAFQGCNSLKTITLHSLTCPTVTGSSGNSNFSFRRADGSNDKNLPIINLTDVYVLPSAVDTYKNSTYWSWCADKIKKED